MVDATRHVAHGVGAELMALVGMIGLQRLLSP